MGLFSFAKNAGASIFKSDEKKADSIKSHILGLLEKQGNQLVNLEVGYDEGAVKLSGICDTCKTREQAILIAGNVEDVEQVDGDGLLIVQAEAAPQVEAPAPAAPQTEAPVLAAPQTEVPVPAAVQPQEGGTRTVVPSPPAAQAAPQAAPPEQESQFYTIKSGDTLSKVAKEFYGSANKYMFIFEENKGVIDDPDKIYPGQVIRIPPLT